MTAPPPLPSIPPEAPAASPERALHKLYLTLFLRGRSSRGLQKKGAPQSIGTKLGLVLGTYALVGLVALAFLHQPIFALSLYLHAMTLVFLGMFVAASSGEMLFNKDEADILMHRPVTPRALLRAKAGVLVRVSLWMAAAFNLAGFFIGVWAVDGGWLFPVAHMVSTILEALFCVGAVVVLYQLCLRWFGRERLDGLMTMAQVGVAVAAVLAGQIPQLLMRFHGKFSFNPHSWWVGLLPPAWFAGLDDLIAGGRSGASAILAAVGFAASGMVLYLAFGALARDYGTGLQTTGEVTTPKRTRPERRRWIDRLAGRAPLKWWLRDPVCRASFLLVAAYLARDRDVKLRVYPSLAPMLIWPVIMLMQNRGGAGVNYFAGFGIAFAGVFIGNIPLLALELLRYSQQWQAGDLFRLVPMKGPGPLCDGARRAVFVFLTLPVVGATVLLLWLAGSAGPRLALLLPGIIALPVYGMVACLGGGAVPLSLPGEEAKSAGRGIKMIGVMVVSVIVAGVSVVSWHFGWFWWFLLGELVCANVVYFSMRASVASVQWKSLE